MTATVDLTEEAKLMLLFEFNLDLHIPYAKSIVRQNRYFFLSLVPQEKPDKGSYHGFVSVIMLDPEIPSQKLCGYIAFKGDNGEDMVISLSANGKSCLSGKFLLPEGTYKVRFSPSY